MTAPPVTSHAAPATWWSRIADVLHRFVTARRPARAVGRHVYRCRSGVGTPRMELAHSLTERARREREQLADARALLRAECERMATLLGGVRRGRAERAVRVLHRSATSARSRFTASTQRATGHVRTAARETAAAAATAARQVGAHRHVGAATRAGHDLAANALATLKSYGQRGRAFGENSIWTNGGIPA
jgi:hypothetical protein